MSSFAVLGLGPSLNDYSGKEKFSIGVNDIHSKVKSDYVVCVDSPGRFTEDRLKTILETDCKRFYSHLDSWAGVKNFEQIKLCYIRGEANYSADCISYGKMSPLCAMVLAVKLGATSITLYGVDLTTHWKFSDPDQGKQCIEHLQEFINKCPVPVRIAPTSPIRQHITLR